MKMIGDILRKLNLIPPSEEGEADVTELRKADIEKKKAEMLNALLKTVDKEEK